MQFHNEPKIKTLPEIIRVTVKYSIVSREDLRGLIIYWKNTPFRPAPARKISERANKQADHKELWRKIIKKFLANYLVVCARNDDGLIKISSFYLAAYNSVHILAYCISALHFYM